MTFRVGDVVSLFFEKTIQTGVIQMITNVEANNAMFIEMPSGAIIKVLPNFKEKGKFLLHNNTKAQFVLERAMTVEWDRMFTQRPDISVEQNEKYENDLKSISTDFRNKTVEKMLTDMCSLLEDQNRHRKRRKSSFPMKRWTSDEENILVKTYSTLVQNGHCRTSDILQHLSARLNRSTKAIDLRMQALRKDCKLIPVGCDVDIYANGFAYPKTRKTKNEIAARNFMKRWTLEEDKILIGFYNRCKANKLKFSSEVQKVAKILDRTDNSVSLRVIGLKKKFPDEFVVKPGLAGSLPSSPEQTKGIIYEALLDVVDEVAERQDNDDSLDFQTNFARSPVSNALFKSYADLMRSPIPSETSSRSNRKGTTWKKWTEYEEDVLVGAINNKPYSVSTSTVMNTVATQLARSTMATTLRLNHLRRKKPFLFKTKKLSRAHVKDEVFAVISDMLNQVEGKPIGYKRGYDSLDFSSPKRSKKSRFEEEIDLSDYESWLNRQKEAVQFSHVFPMIPMSNWNKINSLDTPTF